ncbi:DUF5658 family protein [Kamptonema cortianum]|nr:DUF5658 family protein [Geitlerinema splendidum]MDK3156049.1 DUF5658 family protein [Kamptonema cortianum]
MSTAVLTVVGLVDLISTVLLLNLGAQEGNRFFAVLWASSPSLFVIAKLVMLFGPIAILEFAREKHPTSAEQGTWIAALAYLALWGTQILRLGGILS